MKVVLIAAFVAAMSPMNAHAAAIATGPSAQSVGYTGVVFVASADTSVTYANFDIVRHNVVSDLRRPDGSAPHCVRYLPGECPLFTSGPTIGFGDDSAVVGLSDLEPGLYGFHCSPHAGMRASLLITP